MKDLAIKIRILFLPLLVMTVGFVLLYPLLHWLVFIRLRLLSFDDNVADLFLPLLLPWLPILLWYRKKTKIITVNATTGRKNDPRFGMQMLAWLVMFVPAAIMQSYVRTATGKLTKLENITQLPGQPVTMYYTIHHFYLDKSNPLFYSYSIVTGKHKETLDFNKYFLVPVRVDSATNDTTAPVIAWFGMSYNKSMSNNLTEEEETKRWDAFVTDSRRKFDEADLNDFAYLENTGNNNDRRRFIKTLEKAGLKGDATTVFLQPVKASFESRNDGKLPWVFGSFGIGMALFFVIMIYVKIDEQELNRDNGFTTHKTEEDNELKDFLK